VKLPPIPTAAPPGSLEKLEVLEQRAANGLALFHPYDAREPGDSRTIFFLEMNKDECRTATGSRRQDANGQDAAGTSEVPCTMQSGD
jgi:hypothetical protein